MEHHIIKVTIWKNWEGRTHQVRVTGIPSGASVHCVDSDNLLLQFGVDDTYEVEVETETISQSSED